MEQNDKTGKVTATVQEIAYSNMFLVEAIFELLAEKGILTGEEVLERIKKLKSEARLQFRWMQWYSERREGARILVRTDSVRRCTPEQARCLTWTRLREYRCKYGRSGQWSHLILERDWQNATPERLPFRILYPNHFTRG